MIDVIPLNNVLIYSRKHKHIVLVNCSTIIMLKKYAVPYKNATTTAEQTHLSCVARYPNRVAFLVGLIPVKTKRAFAVHVRSIVPFFAEQKTVDNQLLGVRCA